MQDQRYFDSGAREADLVRVVARLESGFARLQAALAQRDETIPERAPFFEVASEALHIGPAHVEQSQMMVLAPADELARSRT